MKGKCVRGGHRMKETYHFRRRRKILTGKMRLKRKNCDRALAWASSVAGSGLVVYVNPVLQRLRVLVEAARGRLAELEAGFTVE